MSVCESVVCVILHSDYNRYVCRNPFMPASIPVKKYPRSKSRTSKHSYDLETVTIDKLALDIREIMGEASTKGE